MDDFFEFAAGLARAQAASIQAGQRRDWDKRRAEPEDEPELTSAQIAEAREREAADRAYMREHFWDAHFERG